MSWSGSSSTYEIPHNTESMIVFPLKEEAGVSHYSMIMYNPLQTADVISKEEVQAKLQRLQQLPHFVIKPPFSRDMMLCILVGTLIAIVASIINWSESRGQNPNPLTLIVTLVAIGGVAFLCWV